MTTEFISAQESMPADMLPEPDMTSLPPRELLPASLHALYDAREAAWERYSDFDSTHAELLSMGWESALARKDEAAGHQAISDGIDPLSVPSALEDARIRRPRIVGALKALIAEVNKADRALCSAVRRELGPIGDAIRAELDEAADAYTELQRQADTARQIFGAKVKALDWWTDWAKLELRSHWYQSDHATPTTVQGQEATDIYGRPIGRGAAEVKAVLESYGAVVTRERRTIRSTSNGSTVRIDASHAASLVRMGEAEYADEPEADSAEH
ncbi:hypothetical protein ACFVZC_17295 [Streptomyces marokkonensis]|uniref:Uncharacterized protein n=1 Tax=Streptomyces marokkonensis TaxID=324855 RepID=A0ABW6Q7N6_9ACTN